MAEHPAYQTAFLIIALLMVLVLGFWLYWITSESYRWVAPPSKSTHVPMLWVPYGSRVPFSVGAAWHSCPLDALIRTRSGAAVF